MRCWSARPRSRWRVRRRGGGARAAEPEGQVRAGARPSGSSELVQAAERHHGDRFVGRSEELAVLRGAWERALGERPLRAGDDRRRTGRGEVAAGRGADRRARRTGRPRPLSFLRRGDHLLPRRRGGQAGRRAPGGRGGGRRRSVAARGTRRATSADEIAWAFRKLLEQAAPLLVVFDDIQWGEETFLDLVEQVALLSTGAPLMVLCLARPELSERRPRWPIALKLGPLPPVDVEELLPATVLGAAARTDRPRRRRQPAVPHRDDRGRGRGAATRSSCR